MAIRVARRRPRPGGQASICGMLLVRMFSSAMPNVTSLDPLLCSGVYERSHWPAPEYHQPNTRSQLGGRSPTMSVLLVPSVMSLIWTFEHQ